MTIKNAAKQILDQLGDVIDQFTKENYCQPIPKLGNSTLGQHIRHTLEFFISLKNGIDQGVVNYDNRKRDIFLENDPDTALKAIKKIKEFIDNTSSKIPLKLVVDYGMKGNETQLMETNFNRELAYNIEHAVHHMAILKIGISEISNDIAVPEGFGIAVSTQRYRKEHVHTT